MISIELLKLQKDLLSIEVQRASKAISAYTSDKRLPNGLLPDEYKNDEYKDEYKNDEYKALKRDYDNAFQALRNFNGAYGRLLRKAR